MRKYENVRKTTCNIPRKTTLMKKTRRGHGGNSPVAKLFVKNQELKQIPNLFTEVMESRYPGIPDVLAQPTNWRRDVGPD